METYLGSGMDNTAMLIKGTSSVNGIFDYRLAANGSVGVVNDTNSSAAVRNASGGHQDMLGYSTPHVILASLLVTVIMFVIVFGNFLVVVAIATDRNLKTTQNWFIASLAVADFLLGIVIMPFSLANELMGYWYFGYLWCDLWKAIDVLLCTASILSICLISLDRYWSITRAMEYSSQRTPTRAAMMIAAVWILSAVICVPPLIGWKNPLPVSDYPLCLLSDEIGYVLYSTMGSFYIPCIIMVFVYFKIFRAARALARRNMHRKSNISAAGDCGSKSPTELLHTKLKSAYECPSSLTVMEEIQSSVAPSPECGWHGQNSAQGQKPLPRLTNERSKLILTDSDTGSLGLPKLELDPGSKESKAITGNGNANGVQPTGETPCKHQGSNTNSTTNNFRRDAACDHDEAMLADNPSSSPEQTIMDANENSSTEVEKNDSSEHKHTVNIRKLSHPFGKKRHFRSGSDKSSKGWRMTGSLREHERHKRKIAKARERRATIVLGIIMAAFILCWFPFFTLYIITSFCYCVGDAIFAVVFWAGYCNSALNPIIYTVFNRDFRHAFHKIICVRLFRNKLCV